MAVYAEVDTKLLDEVAEVGVETEAKELSVKGTVLVLGMELL